MFAQLAKTVSSTICIDTISYSNQKAGAILMTVVRYNAYRLYSRDETLNGANGVYCTCVFS